MPSCGGGLEARSEIEGHVRLKAGGTCGPIFHKAGRIPIYAPAECHVAAINAATDAASWHLCGTYRQLSNSLVAALGAMQKLVRVSGMLDPPKRPVKLSPGISYAILNHTRESGGIPHMSTGPSVRDQQKVTVEHVHVHAGGQAVVGMVAAPGGGERPKSEDQPHAKQIAHAPERALPCPDANRDAVPVASDGERAVPDARRQSAWRTEGQ
jgi:hypothetical protein